MSDVITTSLRKAGLFFGKTASSVAFSDDVCVMSVSMLDSLSRQLAALRKLGYGVVGFDPGDLVVVDHRWLLLLSDRHLMCLTDGSGSCLRFLTPFAKPTWCAPEIRDIVALPAVDVDYERALAYAVGLVFANGVGPKFAAFRRRCFEDRVMLFV